VSEATKLDVPLGAGRSIAILRPADQEKLLERALASGTAAEPDAGTPYYAELWPAALPLAKWLLEERACREGGRVLELGCGLGLVGLALAKVAGAKVALTDGSEPALELVRRAVELNRPFAHEPAVARLDWREPDASVAALGGRFPVVVGADVLYAPENFEPLARAAAASLRPDGVLYLAEPQRPVARTAPGHLERAGLTLVEKARAENGVVVQAWSFPQERGKRSPRCG
jgi:SAM-dependent methyltransferase